MQLDFPEEIEYQYNLAFDTIMSYRDSKSYSQLKKLAFEQRKQCLAGIEFLEISDVAVAIHDELLFENPPMVVWVENGAIPEFEELRKYVKAKKDTAEIIRSLYSKYPEKMFYAIAVAYQVERNRNNKIILTEDDPKEFENQGFYNKGEESEEEN